MSAYTFPAPLAYPAGRQHEVADPATAKRLVEAIPDRSKLLAELSGKHVVSISHFGPELILQLFHRAAACEAGMRKPIATMACKVMGGNFIDETRPETQLAFKRAWHVLGGAYLDLGDAVYEILRSKRDPTEIAALNNNYCDFAVVSTPRTGILQDMLEHSQVPLINAGTGDDEDPTQALTVLYTILKWRPDLAQGEVPSERRLHIGIFGTPANTDSIRSLLLALAMFPQIVEHIVLLERVELYFSEGQRAALEQAGLRISTMTELRPHDTVMEGLEKIVPKLDVIYTHLRQQHSVSRMDMLELKSFFKPNLMLLSPQRQLPEFSTIINDSPHNAFFAQARAGVFVRMALLSAVMA